MSLFSSFTFPSNSFLCLINKSALGLAGVWTGLIFSCYFGISFRYILYWTSLSASKSFPDNSSITLYLFSESRKYSSLQSPETSFFFPYQFTFLSHTLFFFLFESTIKFWLSTKVSTFSAAMFFFFFIDTHAHMLKNYTGKDSYLSWSVYMREKKRTWHHFEQRTSSKKVV